MRGSGREKQHKKYEGEGGGQTEVDSSWKLAQEDVVVHTRLGPGHHDGLSEFLTTPTN